MRSSKIPEGWEYWTTESGNDDAVWATAVTLKHRREELRPDLLVRVRVVRAGGVRWILRREEPRVTEKTA
jgi:squalene cyclase